MTPSTVLLTAFEPFGGHATNASRLALDAMDPARLPDAELVREELPCVFGDAIDDLRRLLRAHRPDVVICVGQAGGRPSISVERVAINVDDAGIRDNAGAQPIDRAIVERGPVGYWSTLPIKAIVRALEDAKIPAHVSQTAGTFVCNHVFYGLMRSLARRPGVRGGFVHVPYVSEQQQQKQTAMAPTLPLVDVARALEIAVQTTLATDEDVREARGATH